MSSYLRYCWFFTGFIFIGACHDLDRHSVGSSTLFTLLDPEYTNIKFENKLTYTNDFNIYKYRNFYNGGGVGIGDVNNDGLMDIYLSANMKSNRLFLNKGNLQFEDVTIEAGVSGKRAWSTGVSMVDVNGDGWLDIYVCNSGDVAGDNKQNEFFINNGDGTFTDKAEEIGLADKGYSTHAAFFDYDKDGDLDVYLLNNSYKAIGSFNLMKNERSIRDKQGGDKLLRNDNGRFIDVSTEAGIYGSVIGFGLGVCVSDLDKDGWMDMYISNDFFERDYIYMNNGDGTFREELEKQMKSISVASMGSDIADISGDGFPEIFVTEMLPESDSRYKTTMTFEDWDKYQYNVKNGYYHQFTRNMLHLNNGIIKDKGITFSEVGRMADVEATDWSWSALLTDFNNDGFKDIFISNGINKDILDQDYLNYIANEEIARMVISETGVDYNQLIDIIPSNKISNYAFSGGSHLTFTNQTENWGLATPSHSNGSAYGDLDNDGDLDLIVNNVNMPLFIYRNNSREQNSNDNFLKVILKGEKKNVHSVGAKITLKAKGKTYYQEQYPNRGFQSSVDNRLNFGLGNITKVDTLLIEWYYGNTTVLTGIAVNQTLILKESESSAKSKPHKYKDQQVEKLFHDITESLPLDYEHNENEFVDFDRDRLLYHMKSTEGPRIALGDVNMDGRDDIFIGGAKDLPGKLFFQTATGGFKFVDEEIFEKDKASEDIDCLFLDVDGDGDLDLYVISGGNELPNISFALVDRLYLNNGKGHFSRSNQILPNGKPESTSTVAASDIDGDGSLDLFVGVRLRNGLYGVPQSSYILKNDKKGNFTNVTENIAPELAKIGMVTDAVWSDYDLDGDEDLFIVGEWMELTLFENQNGKFHKINSESGLANTSGWWNTIISGDFNKDGYPDFIAGNHGLNSRFKASDKKPISCYINDFDHNGTVEQIICQYNGDQSYPFALRHNLVKQLPQLKKKFLKYESYKERRMEDIFTKEELQGSVEHMVTILESVIVLSNGKGKFDIRVLPREAQYSPIYGLLAGDFDEDGSLDVLLGGNLYGVKPEVGRYDASDGLFLKGDGDGNFHTVKQRNSGLVLEGEVRDFAALNMGARKLILVARNDDKIQIIELNQVNAL